MPAKPFEVLCDGLRSADPLVQAEAARLLGELGSPAAVAPLLDYVRTSRHYHKAAGYTALGRLGDRSVCAELRAHVERPGLRDDWYWYGCRAVRACVAVALLELGDEAGADFLRQLADKSDDVFFCWLAPALLRLGHALPAARELKGRLTAQTLTEPGFRRTRHTEPGNMAMKAEALGLIGGPVAAKALLEMMKFHSRCVRGQAALSLLRASAGEVPLPSQLQQANVATVEALADGDPTDFVRIKAALALALLGARHGGRAKFIADLAGRIQDPFDRAVAVEALGLLGSAAYAAAVAGQLDHEDAYVRQCALEALERIDPAAAARAAKKADQDDSPRVRLQAARILAAQQAEDKQ